MIHIKNECSKFICIFFSLHLNTCRYICSSEYEILEIYCKLFVGFVIFQKKNSLRKYFPGLCCTTKRSAFHIKELQFCTKILFVVTFFKKGNRCVGGPLTITQETFCYGVSLSPEQL